MAATFETLMAMDARLTRAGHHPLTPWWRDRLREFYAHPTARTFVGRVGRGGAKSHTSVWVGLNETLYGDWLVPPGEIHFWVQVSENKSEAAERLRLYCKALDDLHVEYERSGDVIIIPGLRRGIRVLACQIGAVSGFRAFGYAADELAKWESTDTAANPAQEVCTSLDAMTVQYPDARSLLISSPWGCSDFHATTFDQGDTEFQVVAHAETWVAVPSTTREQCWRKAKGIERVFLREYGAVPGPDVEHSYFDPGFTLAAFDLVVPSYYRPTGEAAVTADLSSGRGDGCVWGAWQWFAESITDTHMLVAANNDSLCRLAISPITGKPIRKKSLPPPRGPILKLMAIDGIFGRFFDKPDCQPPTILDRICAMAHRFGARKIFADQHGAFFAKDLARQRQMQFIEIPVTGANKEPACDLVRTWLDTSSLSLPSEGEAARKLKTEFLSFTATLTSGGRMRLEGPSNGSDDAVMMTVMAALSTMSKDPRQTLGRRAARGAITTFDPRDPAFYQQ